MKNYKNRSKELSYLLRHNPKFVNPLFDIYGWVDVNNLIENTSFSLEELKEIVEKDTRYEFNNDFSKIRAFHGHSVKGIIYSNKEIPPKTLYHGTSIDNYEKIIKDGFIKGMSRVQVHLSESKENALNIGKRHGNPIVLIIDTNEMVKEGFTFFKSGDGVWLTNDIPIKYIKNKEFC